MQHGPDYARLLPDWDPRKIVPTPVGTFITRLERGSFPATTSERISMKGVQNVYKYFKHTFAGDSKRSWAKHVDEMESEVFERENFYPKQCYYALRTTLRDDAKTTIQLVEQGLEQPQWREFIPPWYRPTADDLTRMLHAMPFTTFSYPLKLALIIVYFHRKFSKGSAKAA